MSCQGLPEPLVALGLKYNRVLFRLPGPDGDLKGHSTRKWTKRDAFVYMDADSREFHEGYQVQSAFHLWVKTPDNIRFLEEWIRWCSDPRVVTDDANVSGLANLDGFVDHRHDQSVLSIMAIKYNVQLFQDPSQFGSGESAISLSPGYSETFRRDPNSSAACGEYGQILLHHRQRV